MDNTFALLAHYDGCFHENFKYSLIMVAIN